MSEDLVSDALKMLPYGFYALGSKASDDQNLMVLNWVSQVSFEPLLLAVAIQKTSHSYGLIEKGKAFTLNIFHSADRSSIEPFTKSRATNPDKMKAAAITAAPKSGAPVIDGAAAFLEYEVRQKVETGGDHDIFIGEVVGAEVRKAGKAGETLNLPEMGWSYAG